MKVGVITLSSGYNYGGSLQSFALKKILEGQGHQVKVVNYYPVDTRLKPFWRGWGLRGRNRFLNCRRRLLELVHLKSYRIKYDDFKRNELDLTIPCVSYSEVSGVLEEFEAIVIGSDQVWNLNYHDDPVFYLASPLDYRGRKVSYAACCGQGSKRRDEWIKDALSDFDAISVRNSFTKLWVEQLEISSEKEPVQVVDPTVLYDFSEIDPRDSSEPYLFVYLLSDADEKFHRTAIEKIRKRHRGKGSLKVVLAMATGIKITPFQWADEVLWMLNPFEWVSWLAGATHVYTDSFHAVIFSLKNQVPVLAYYNEAIRAPRLRELSEDFGIEAAVISIESDSISMAVGHEFEWKVIQSRMKESRGDSLRFLEVALDKV